MFRNLVLVQVVLLSFQSLLYFGCEMFQHRIHNVKLEIDDRIPFLPWSVLFYCLWFPLIAVYPLAVYNADPVYYCNYLVAMILEILVSVVCYLVYPTSFKRPDTPDTFWGNFMKLIYHGSYRGLNCAPSLHCSSCYLIIWVSITCLGMEMWIRVLAIVVAVLIVLSTMTTKQHAVIDVVTAAPLFGLCYGAGAALAVQLYPVVVGFIGS